MESERSIPATGTLKNWRIIGISPGVACMSCRYAHYEAATSAAAEKYRTAVQDSSLPANTTY